MMSELSPSGYRLMLARKHGGHTQESLLDEPNFPNINVKTLRRWEQQGINPTRVEEVARYFQIEVWSFLDPRLTDEDFLLLIDNPTLTAPLKARYAKEAASLAKGERPQRPPQSPTAPPEAEEYFQALQALELEDQDLFLSLLHPDFAVNYAGPDGWTLLHWAAHRGRLFFAQTLLGLQADLEARDTEGLSPLIIAAARNHSPLVALFLERGCELDRVDQKGWSALTWAAAHNNLTPLGLLMNQGANPNLPDYRGDLPLFRAIRSNFVACVSQLFSDQAPKPANPNRPDPQGELPLHLALRLGFPLVVQRLLQAGADPMGKNRDKVSAWELAKELSDPKMVTLFRESSP